MDAEIQQIKRSITQDPADKDIYAVYDYSARDYTGVKVAKTRRHDLGVQGKLYIN